MARGKGGVLYNNVKSCVSLNRENSEFFECQLGLRQGENLSPILFALYVDDLQHLLSNFGNQQINFKNEECNRLFKLMVLMYANYTVIMANDEINLQLALDNLVNYCNKWKWSVNTN